MWLELLRRMLSWSRPLSCARPSGMSWTRCYGFLLGHVNWDLRARELERPSGCVFIRVRLSRLLSGNCCCKIVQVIKRALVVPQCF